MEALPTMTQTALPSSSSANPRWRETVDRDLATLQDHAQGWAQLSIATKIELLRGLRTIAAAKAREWVELATRAKGLDMNSPLAGEEWTSGPWAFIYGVNRLEETLQGFDEDGEVRLRKGSVRTRPDGQVVVEVFPQGFYDRLLLSGVRAEVWMEPGVSEASLRQSMAGFYRQRDPRGAVALVLGAGNVASIAPLDVLYKLYAEGSVCILKMNPVNDYLGPLLEEIFAEFVGAGYLRTVYGGADVGTYVAQHNDVDEIHITGSAKTHDAILFGPGPEGEQRRRDNRPLTTKRMTSELGNVSPTIVVPGPWDDADIRFQAEHIATQKMHNGGFNCIAAQVLVMPEGWNQGPSLVDEVERVIAETPYRSAYYPGASGRQQAFASAHPGAHLVDKPSGDVVPRTIIAGLDSDEPDEVCFRSEVFASVLTVTSVAADDPGDYLLAAIDFANDRLLGTLGANIIIHPETMKALGERFEQAVSKLRYGFVAVNSWTGVGFLIAQASWGAFPGHTPDDIQSGTGVVHNSLLFDRPQKSVIYQPFYPFPRGLRHGQAAMLPKPPWFITNKRAHKIGQRLVEFEAAPNPLRLVPIFSEALRG
jgi:aldehyde dehydrogenase (NAD(P)+)